MSSIVIRYKCSYCNKELKTPKGIQHHEKARCYHNPDNHTCFTCGLFVKSSAYSGVQCENGHDCFWDKFSGEYQVEEPIRQLECEFYEPRSDHPGEYGKYSSGCGGWRKIWMEGAK